MFARTVRKITRINQKSAFQFVSFAGKYLKPKTWNFSTKVGLFSLIGAGVAGYSNSNILSSDEFYEKTIPANLQNGQKIEVQVGATEEDAVLVAKVDGKYYCVSNKCPHYGAPLGKGPLFYDKIFCPYHSATFSVIDGQAEGGPMLNGLERFEVTEKDGQLHIKVSKNRLNMPLAAQMVKPDPSDTRNFVIIGGGPSGISAAESLRQAGYTGKIKIISKEQQLPYDRTILSKDLFFAQINQLIFRNKQFLDTYGIEVITSTEVLDIDPQKKSVKTNTNRIVPYDKLLISTGSSAKRIPIEGANSKNVYTLRNFNDMQNLKTTLQDAKKLVIIGASFVGLETASNVKDFLKDKIEITVVDVAKVPYEKVLGEAVGAAVQKLHSDNGIKFNMNVSIKEIKSSNGIAKQVVLSNGTVLEADAILLGTGVSPNTSFVGDKLEKDSFGGLKTDVFLQTSNPNIFASGETASYPYHYTGQRARLEHMNSSIYQGYIAALNMLGQKTPVSQIPFFWTRFWNNSLHYTGYTSSYDNIHIEGDLNKFEFAAWYIKNNRIVAYSSMNRDTSAMVIGEAMKQNVMPSGSDIIQGKVNFEDIKLRVEARGANCKCSKGSNCCSARKAQKANV